MYLDVFMVTMETNVTSNALLVVERVVISKMEHVTTIAMTVGSVIIVINPVLMVVMLTSVIRGQGFVWRGVLVAFMD